MNTTDILRKFKKAFGFGWSFCLNEASDRMIGKSRLPVSPARRAFHRKKHGVEDDIFNAFKYLYFTSNLRVQDLRVLEIGGSNIPGELLFNDLRASRWTCVDYLDVHAPEAIGQMNSSEGNNNKFCVKPLEEDSPPFHESFRYVKYNGDANEIPETFSGQFDAVISIACFEHALRLDNILKNIHRCLKPGGWLYSYWSPIWSSPNGHHCRRIRDEDIQPFIHLLKKEEEVRSLLGRSMYPELLEALCYCAFHRTTTLNRLFYEDYEKLLADSPFTDYSMVPHLTNASRSNIDTLQKLYPGYKRFDASGISLLAFR